MPAARTSRRAWGSWGWHRLTEEWAARVVAEAGVRPGELVLDIGAGEGALTAPLLRAGARVVVVELHPGRAAKLSRRFGDVTVVHADATNLRLPNRPFRVVANPPYGITADLLGLLLAPGTRLVAADLVLQRAVVRKYAEARQTRSFAMTRGLALPRRAFRLSKFVVRPATLPRFGEFGTPSFGPFADGFVRELIPLQN